MTMNRHEAWEELISASLHGDLTADEQDRLDGHLATCGACRATLEAFTEDRRMLGGLRHVAPPRDLGARVRTGIELAAVPWWRRPATIFTAVGGSLAAVAGALLALVILNGTTNEPPVGVDVSPTPVVDPSVTPEPTLPPTDGSTPTPAPGPSDTPAPSSTPAPTDPVMAEDSEPDVYVALTGPSDNQAVIVADGATSSPVAEPAVPAAAGPPVAAELSPESAWLALVSEGSFSGINTFAATRIGESIPPDDPEASPRPTPPTEIGGTTALGESVAGSPFLERMAWTRDGSMLAYTLADEAGGGTDVWIFRPSTDEVWALTDVGDAYAASWVEDEGTSEAPARLWVSRAEGTVASHLVEVLDESGAPVEAIDPAEVAVVSADNVFQPLLSPNGNLAIYWKGVMAQEGSEWVFSEGGAPYLAEHGLGGGSDTPFSNERTIFSDLTIDRDAFRSAGIVWGLDGNSYAVWDIDWSGESQSSTADGTYPDPNRVYLGRATELDGIQENHALDAGDWQAGWRVVDVKVAPTGVDLLVTVARPLLGDLDVPEAELLLITRGFESDPDTVETLCAEEGRWCGPAAFDAYTETEEGAESP